MTTREFYQSILTHFDPDSDEAAFATAALEKLAARNEKANAKAREKRAAAENPLLPQIEALLTDEPQTYADLAAQLNTSWQKVMRPMNKLVELGKATAQEVKIPNHGKKKAFAKA